MVVALTGSSGFIGSNLKNHLQISGIEVFGINLRDEILPELPPDAVCVIHLVGLAHDLKNVSQASDYYRVNVDLTKKIFQAFLHSNANTFIYFSSVKAVADIVVGDCLTESMSPNPKTHYGLSKLDAEEYLLANMPNDGRRLIIFRPCMVHGPGNKGNLNLLYSVVSKGFPWPLGAFENKRSFLSIQNLCWAVDYVLNGVLPAGIYNLADSDSVSTNRLIELIGEEMHKRIKILKISPKVVKCAAKIGDSIKIPFTTERLEKLTENYVVSNRKLIDTIGAEMPISVETGLRNTIQSFNTPR